MAATGVDGEIAQRMVGRVQGWMIHDSNRDMGKVERGRGRKGRGNLFRCWPCKAELEI